MRFFKFKRLKIVEQIGIVFFFAVLIPMSVFGFIINNVNQQSMRYQLRESAILITNMVSDEIDFFADNVSGMLEHLAFSLKYMKNDATRKKYLEEVQAQIENCESIVIAKNLEDAEIIKQANKTNNNATITVELENGEVLVATFSLLALQDDLFNSLQDDKRQIFILTNDGRLLASHNFNQDDFQKTMASLPKHLKKNKPVIFGDVKNQPLVYVKKDNPQITIIVNTTEDVTDKMINRNRLKIILSTLAATLFILFVTALYTFHLYINIRQLFKGIIAISKGNYERQIRLLITAFTPHEIVFLAFEFNRMVSEIQKSYKQLKKNNKELNELNDFRKNLIDTVSHELRTPLTSIQGYTSRLMRNDIVIDEETKQKSLRVIKEQSERLKRLIEDLLTIPDIEGMRIRVNSESVYLPEVFETSRILVRNKDDKEILINISEDFPNVLGDKTRLEQVFVNLIENAVKYAYPDSAIIVDTKVEDGKAKVFVKNECDVIPSEKLGKLFEKFMRLDDNTTRTTRGTGLGLFIVKGLVEAMNGSIELRSDENCGFCVEVTLNLAEVDEVIDAESN